MVKSKLILCFLLILVGVCLVYWNGAANTNSSKISLPEMGTGHFTIVEKKTMKSDVSTNVEKNQINNITEIQKVMTKFSFSGVKPPDGSMYPFNINSTDVMVHIHIQKNGGTSYGRTLTENLDQVKCSQERRKFYKCQRPNDDSLWLFSRFTTGWFCGLHADFTSLSECVPSYFKDSVKNPQKRYFYFTMLREPVARYISEWLHVARGATWEDSYLRCNEHRYDYPSCYNGSFWMDVPLAEFMACKDNTATNRQTRMLSDLRRINCTGEGLSAEEKDKIMLQSAKQNLKDMVYFGLIERQKESRVLFEKAFGLHFTSSLRSFDGDTRASRSGLSEDEIESIEKLNNLDIELYEYATALFEERYNAAIT